MSRGDFTTVRVVGGLLPTDVLGRVLAGDKDLGGLSSTDFHLPAGESPREAANRAWPYLLGAWKKYKEALAKLPEGDPAVGLTREKWLTVLFKELDYGRLQTTPPGGIVIDEKSFPVSHLWGATPLHLLGWGVDLDKRTKGVHGAAERAPQAMVQELLNRTDGYLWAMLSNGRTIRLLRDSTSLAGQAYVEFDLESMFEGEVFSDFVLLYLLLHQSRVEVPSDGIPADCWLEKWRTAAAESGTRALGLLRDGVQEAIEALGTGFLQAQGNDLNDRLAEGSLKLEDYHRSLLRLVYRLLFLFVAEDRGLLHEPHADPVAIERYRDYFSTSRLRDLARKRRGGRHTDLYDALKITLHGLATSGGRPEIALPGLGGIFTDEPIDVVSDADLPNQALLTALRKLSIVHPKGSPPRTVDYRNLGAEELGSIYESLLELVPRHDQIDRTFTLELLAGNDRKTSGSYYTPTSLIDLVLDEALDPILDEKEREKDAEEALLGITVCDPACGSGHFLVGAARRIATRLASVRTGETDPTPTDVQHALHDVVARCIYGVDLNPMAAELAKVSLWLEAMEPGRPLSFLDAHIKVGNALIGTTPRLIAEGIPDAAFDPIEGDDKKYASSLKKRNRQEREQSASGHEQGGLFDEEAIDVSNAHLRGRYAEAIDQSLKAADLTQLAAAEKRYREAQESPEACRARLVADTWCAAFVQPQVPGAISITQTNLELAATGGLTADVEAEVARLSTAFGFFHWFLEFPEIFPVCNDMPTNAETGWDGGFTVLLGNPPWGVIEVVEKEFFASRDAHIAAAETAAKRRSLIAGLEATAPALYRDFLAARWIAGATTGFLRGSGAFPLTAQGKLNTYRLFAERFLQVLNRAGIMAVITPTGLGTGATSAEFIGHVVADGLLLAFVDFDNEERIFPGVHHSIHFAMTAIAGRPREGRLSRLAFGCRSVSEVRRRYVTLSTRSIGLMNPNTRTLPVLASQRDADIATRVYESVPVLSHSGGAQGQRGWSLDMRQGLFNMSSDSGLFSSGATERQPQAGWVPLYEGKMIFIWDPRYATYAGATQAQLNVGTLPRLSDAEHQSPEITPVPNVWVPSSEVDRRVGAKWSEEWLLVFRLLTGTAAERTFVPTLIPRFGVGNSLGVAFLTKPGDAVALQALWSSLTFDYFARQKLTGNNMSFFIVEQLPCPFPGMLEAQAQWAKGTTIREFLTLRALELTVTDWGLSGVLRTLGFDPRPFRWLPDRRETLAAEIDAAVAHVYGLEREDLDFVLDTFPVLRRYDERDHGEFRTKRQVLAEYDRMAEAAATGIPYESSLDPAPGFGPRHSPSTIPDWF